MTEIYWLQRIGNISDAFTVAFWLTLVVIAFFAIAFPIFAEDWDDEVKELLKKWARRIIIPLCISGIGCIFIPSKKELYAIYGLGGTIDYIKSNDKAKQLPDKVVDALTRYVDSIEADKKKKD